jgi:hypothetical protein
MLLSRRVLFMVLGLAVFAGVACSKQADGSSTPVATDEATSTDGAGTSVATEMATSEAGPAGPQFGIAGLIPRHFPNAEFDDYVAMYDASRETGTLFGVYGNWSDDKTTPGDIPEVFLSGYAAVDQFDAPTPVIAVGWASENPVTGVMNPTLDWSDSAQAAQFTSVVVKILGEYHPPFFILGAEINRIWEQHPAAFDAFVAAWPDVYAAMKAASPETEIGASFQYEWIRGAGYLSGQTRSPQWEIVDRFDGVLDFLALSTYPFFDYETPDAIPDDYYAEAAERYGLPLAFSEMGWPSRPLSTFPESGYGGTEEEQAAFAARFLDLIDGLDVRFALWSFQFDVGDYGGPTFESVSLRENDGTPKPALEVWASGSP